MGFVDKLRGQLIDIIEFLDDSRDTIVWRFPRQGNEIKNQAQLIVREGQVAVFVSEGQIADVFEPGHYTLETKNLPILSTLKGWKYGFNSPFKAEVYFVATRQFTDFKWGTQHPITLRDPEFGMVRLRAFGTYSLKVSDPSAMLRQLVGTDSNFRTDEIGEFFRQNIIGHLAPAIASSGIPMLDLAANQQSLSSKLAPALSAELAEFGVTIPKFVIENVSLPPEVEAALDKRTQMAQSIAQANQAAAAPAAPAGPPPLPVTDELWYFSTGSSQSGPVTPEALAQHVAAGQVTRDTLVWKQGLSAWTAAGQVPNLAGLFTAPPPLPPSAATPGA